MSYIRAMDRNLNLGATGITVDRNMFGPALQAGVDYNLQDKWLVNIDVKKYGLTPMLIQLQKLIILTLTRG